ncbi:hypothetical protein L3C95_01845 [Chitinophaga filiformis]|uniref:hypothetical protein n=1 Tax=Chitinophaga filiformis TaxID=104663 RepID=UPI001F2AA2AE|nr:hypothetical protein [Chitinophaga filiformis]MCF6401597.1 hypothetical protein [Chitinophaga filiformis]
MKRSMPFKVEIPLPCEQSWENMKPMDDGRYCDHCSRKIVDFTKLADHEVVRLFLDSSGPVCGRFTESQLNRDLLALEKERANALVPALLVSTALAAGVASNAVASHGQMKDMRQIERRDTTGAPVVPAVNNKDNGDTTELPVAGKVGLFSDLGETVLKTTFDIDTEIDEEVVVMGFMGAPVPKTKRERRKIEQRYQMKFSEAVRSKPLRITAPPPASDEKK